MHSRHKPEDLIMIEPEVKRPMFRAQQPENKRMYKWTTGGEEIRINEPDLYKRLESVNMVCSVEILVRRLYNTHSLVIDTRTGEVMDGSAAA